MIFNWLNMPEYPAFAYAINWSGAGSSYVPPSGTAIREDKINLGFRNGVNQADVLVGGFG